MNPYAVTANGAPSLPYNPFYGSTTPYPYLLPFFASEKSAATNAGTAPQLYRLLEYVGVPSRFVQTETFINPNSFGSAGGQVTFFPPFNRISAYRDPGKMNLNTMYTQDQFNGLMGYFPGTTDGTLWNKFVQSRRGAGGSTDPLAFPTSPTPSRFANPFRSFAGGDFDFSPPAQEINATVFRADPTVPNRPLFQIDATGQLPSAATGPAQDPDRNPYFRYQALARLGNLVTTRSNVYAIWITVGYFQVSPNPNGADAAHPDGYQLGQELGSDTGEIERHRAFYIYDRTIPVGFVRGQDTNVEKGLLLRRYIE